ncbi:hypothetical protein HMPREF0297_1111 [Corynebacterium jeikeium ATCC 43734]|nr:hypothetical protein HMPREF0297_1111 [Corynebacterium jeikeium ATCC 43734]
MRFAERLPRLRSVAPVSIKADIARRNRLGSAVARPFGLLRDLAALGFTVLGGAAVAGRDDALTHRPPVAVQ